jgi:multidrug efflux pump subunit AcrA (membrane-fusion protein)
MRNDLILDLSECTDVRQAFRARVPTIVHSSTILLVLLFAAALAWMVWAQAHLVVRAKGRIRPATSIGKAFDVFSEEISGEVGGRVVEVRVTEGDEVRAGDILFRLDTEHVDNHIAQRRLRIQAGKEELANLERFDGVLAQRYASAQRKAAAELSTWTEILQQNLPHFQYDKGSRLKESFTPVRATRPLVP